MQLLETHAVTSGTGTRFIKLYQGDLSQIPREEAVDVLVVSAFPNDYAPTPRSLIGALDRRGVSLAALARDKAVDLRETFSCWLSKDVPPRERSVGFERILCFEPLSRGNPAELTGDIFRAIMPFALGEEAIRSLAMPVLASGDQQFDEVVMFTSLFRATVQWLSYGLPIDVVKIVVRSDESAARLREQFLKLRAIPPRRSSGTSSKISYATPVSAPRVPPAAPPSPAPAPMAPSPGTTAIPMAMPAPASYAPPTASPAYDCFISYSHDDADAVSALVQHLLDTNPRLRVFQDKLELKVGDAWQAELDDALATCGKVIAVYSPSYLQSKMCMEEFNMARIRHRESESGVLLPIYLRSAQLPLYMRSIQYVDCRESDLARIQQTCEALGLRGEG